MFGIKKYYTADMVDCHGKLVGGSCYESWFFVSPYEVWKVMNKEKPKEYYLTGFRLVK